MESRSRESNLPSGTWESVWINLIIRAAEEWRNGEYISSWNTTQELYSWLPKECKADVEDLMDEIKKRLQVLSQHACVTQPYHGLRAIRRRQLYHEYLYQKLLDLHGAIQSSLESHDWICKASGVSPQVKHRQPARF